MTRRHPGKENPMKHALCAALLAAALPLAARAASSLTIYSDGFGLISETRELKLEKGRQDWIFDGVSRQIEPSSVLFSCDGARLLEQNFEYDLVDEGTLLMRYLGQELDVEIKEGEWLRGTLLAGGGGLILQTAQGVTSLRPEALLAVRYPKLPEGLRLKPALRWELDAQAAGSRKATITYLSGGLNWNAEYVCLLADDDNSMEMASWVNLSNQTGLTWENAGLQLVAGNVHRNQPPTGYAKGRPRMAMAEAMDGGGFAEESFFEYHLYSLERPVTIKDRQDKQVPLFDPKRVAVTRRYIADSDRMGQGVQVEMAFDNKKDKGPGLPLPEGTVRLYKLDSKGRRQMVGEDRIQHTPVDETVKLNAGRAFDLVAERKVMDERHSGRSMERDIQVELKNRKPREAATILVRERMWGDWTLLSSDVKGEKKDAGTLEFSVGVPAGETRTFHYKVRYNNQ
jgi:hypothetical protein